MLKKRLVAMGLLLALGATGAIAETRQHYATAPTKKEARLLATADARAVSLSTGLCFRPAYQVAECDKIEGGFRCRADSADNARTCRHAGWVRDGVREYSPLTASAPILAFPSVAGGPYAVNAWAISYNPDPMYGYGSQPPSSFRIQLAPSK